MSRKIKRSLAGGALAAIISVLLMYSSTMAWFQDTEFLINTFTFGNVKVEIVDPGKDDHKGTIGFIKSTGEKYGSGEEFLFEPGASFLLEPFCVKNKGSVPFSYAIELYLVPPENDTFNKISSGNESVNLMNAMEVRVKVGENWEILQEETDETQPEGLRNVRVVNFEDAQLPAGARSEQIQLMLHMKEKAGNEYNVKGGLTIFPNSIRVRVLAYQEGADVDEARKNEPRNRTS